MWTIQGPPIPRHVYIEARTQYVVIALETQNLAHPPIQKVLVAGGIIIRVVTSRQRTIAANLKASMLVMEVLVRVMRVMKMFLPVLVVLEQTVL
jgi:hypothetical protein